MLSIFLLWYYNNFSELPYLLIFLETWWISWDASETVYSNVCMCDREKGRQRERSWMRKIEWEILCKWRLLYYSLPLSLPHCSHSVFFMLLCLILSTRKMYTIHLVFLYCPLFPQCTSSIVNIILGITLILQFFFENWDIPNDHNLQF